MEKLKIDEIVLVAAKRVAIAAIDKRMERLTKDEEEFSVMPLLAKQCSVEKLKLSNLKTEICIGLDNEFDVQYEQR